MTDPTDDVSSDDIEISGDEFDQGPMRERRSAGRRGRRRSTGATVNTIYWRDIPAQLTARGTADQHKVLLHARFQHAIDRAAGVAGLTSTNDYVQEWRSVSTPLPDGDVTAQLDQLCAETEAAYPKARLEALVDSGGVDATAPEQPGAHAPGPATAEEDQ